MKIGEVRPCAAVAPKRRKPKSFKGFHARRWMPEDWHKGVQVDHMTVNVGGKTFKEFRAVDPRTRLMHAYEYSVATSGAAADFLAQIEGAWGWKPACIQVDGGSEFMGAFDRACHAMGIELVVLPPRKPEWNGLVERANRTVREECWHRYRGKQTCAARNARLAEYLFYYNYERPHRGIGLRTPSEAAKILEAAA